MGYCVEAEDILFLFFEGMLSVGWDCDVWRNEFVRGVGVGWNLLFCIFWIFWDLDLCIVLLCSVSVGFRDSFSLLASIRNSFILRINGLSQGV